MLIFLFQRLLFLFFIIFAVTFSASGSSSGDDLSLSDFFLFLFGHLRDLLLRTDMTRKVVDYL